MACLDLATFLQLTGTEFLSYGPVSTGTIEWLAEGTAAQTISIGSHVFTAVAGARTPGSNDWSVVGVSSVEAASFVAAVNDPLNSTAGVLTAVATTPTIVTITTVATGVQSELAFTTSAPLVYDLSDTTLMGGGDLLDLQLETACSMISSTCAGDKQEALHLYLTGHLLYVANANEGGAVSSKSIDRISISYAVSPPSDSDFGSTKWGRLYLALRRTIPNIGAISGNSIATLGCCCG